MLNFKCQDLSKSFNSNELFSNIGFELNSGERLVVMGRNGVGKTTLLKILASQLISDTGSIELNSKSFSDLEFLEIKKNVSWVNSEDHGLYPKLTGLDNIVYFSNLLSLSSEQLETRMKPWKEIELFKKALNEKFSLCSIGMKKVLLLFCLTMHDPKILIMDEPFKSFDHENKDRITTLMNELFMDKIIIFSSHDESIHSKFNAQILNLVGGGNAL